MVDRDHSGDEPSLAAEARAAIVSRDPQQTDTTARSRRILIAAGGLVFLTTLLAFWIIAAEPAGNDCTVEKDWPYVWLGVTPIVAAVSVLVIAIAANGPRVAGRLLVFAVVASWVAGFAIPFIYGSLAGSCNVSDFIFGASTVILPAVIGIATVLVSNRWMERRRSS